MEDKIGSLVEGKQADILAVDLKKSNTTPCYDPIASLVYSGNNENIAAVFVEGELIFDQGKFTKVNETDILMRAQQKANELFQLSMKNR
jgi:5-methylthioadenosine/S-adenosylhomocysteine deaminase